MIKGTKKRKVTFTGPTLDTVVLTSCSLTLERPKSDKKTAKRDNSSEMKKGKGNGREKEMNLQ